MKILLLGGGGLAGNIFIKYFSNLKQSEHILGATFSENESNYHLNLDKKKIHTFYEINAFEYKSINSTLDVFKPDVIINTIGLTKRISNRNDPKLSIYLNSYFPHILFKDCLEKNIKLIHLSTDCIFSGKNGNYTEDDISDASDLYGKTKFLGELKEKNALTLRTSILGPEIRRFLGIYSWFINQKTNVYGYDKAFFSGITSLELAKIILQIINNKIDLSGVYHLSSERISKFELLDIIKKIKKMDINITKSNAEIYDRSLNNNKFHSEFGYISPKWENMILELTNYE